ncbi:MAG: YitT family protein [Defluviitaleaceae bacterium]|nr:YitT family protein [Defluviitaleaceae bacterium]
MNNSKTKKLLLEYAMTAAGVTIMTLAIYFFFIPNSLVVGGVSGLATIFYHQFSFPVWATTALINTPLLLIALKVVGFRYITKTIFAAALMSVLLFLLEGFVPADILEPDLFLASIFGGVVCGVGVAITLRADATTGGSTLAADLISRIFKRLSTPRVLLVLDWGVILAGLWVFGAMQTMYALISLFVAIVAIEYFMKWPRFTKGVFIISKESEGIGQALLEKMDRGVTALHGRGFYTKEDKSVLLCVVYNRQIARLKEVVSEIDKDAFVIVTDAREVMGEGFSKIIRD